MPTIYTVEAPDGSLLDIEGPDNATDAQIEAFAAQQFAAQQPREEITVTLRPDITDPAEREQIGLPPLPPPPETTAEGVAGAIGRGLAPVAAGAALGGLVGGPAGAGLGALAVPVAQLVGDPIVDMVNSSLGTSFSTPTEAVQNLLSALGVPQAQTPTERVIQSAAGAVGGAGGMIAGGRALAAGAAPVLAGIGEALAAQPAAQLAGSAAGGAAAQGTAEAGGGPLAQLGAGLLGGVAGAAAIPRPRGPLPAIVGEAEAAGVPLMTSDVVQPRTFVGRNVQMAGERIPVVGTGPVRQTQQEARIAAVKDIVNDYGGTNADALPEKIVTDLAQERSKTIQRYTRDKGDVIERLSSAGTVPMQATVKRIDDEVLALRRRRTAEGDEAADMLESIKADVQNRNLFELESYRRDVLSNAFKDDPARPISIAVREAGEKALRAIYDPVREDMGAFIRQNGQRRDFTKWMVANKRLSSEANELNKQALARVLRQGDATPEVVNQLLFSNKPSDVTALYRNLSPQGRSVARQAIIARAAQKAADGESFSPTRFSTQVGKLGSQIGVFFNGNELERVQGLARVLDATKRAGEAGVVTPTGMQNVAPTAAIGGAGLASLFGGGMTGFAAALASAASVGAAARLYESPAVRNLLLQASRTNNRERLIGIGQRLAAITQADVQNEDNAQ